MAQGAMELHADIAIVGGSVGGCAAALAIARNGGTAILTEETDWIGGQLTSQAVPPDEHPCIEQFGCTRSYRDFRNRVRDYYRRNYPLVGEAYRNPHLNPGNGSVSRLCHEPRVALAILLEMLQPYISNGQVTLLCHHKPRLAQTDGDRVEAILMQNVLTGEECVLHADYVLDATELGDLLPLTGAEFVTGAEAQSETGEPHAPSLAQPNNQQAFTVCFAMDYLDGEDHTIARPPTYPFWRDYVPEMNPPWTGHLLSLTMSHPVTLEPRPMNFDPIREAKGEVWGFWLYRRIIDKANFRAGAFPGDICLVNWPMNDYWLGNLVGVSDAEKEQHLEAGKQLSLSLLYWLQTECPRIDGGTGWKGLRLRSDVVGTSDGLAKSAYVRESRRIRAEFTVCEQHVGTNARMQITGLSEQDVQAQVFSDAVGVGQYRIDLHPSSGGDNYIDIGSLPFQIPLGALIPQRMENLLPACKNLGVTHITNGCYRLHPVEWNIGEAAGLVAIYALQHNTTPRAIRNTPPLLEEFQRWIQAQGIEITWLRARPV
jgi:hypothetical protein